MCLHQMYFSWSIAKGIRRLKVSAYFQILSALIPLYASLALLFREKIGFDIPVPANLVALYFSSLFFFIGSCIFDVLCPRIIKEHPSRYTFVQDCIKYSELTIPFRKQSDKAVEKIVSAMLRKAGEEPSVADLQAAYDAEMGVASTETLEKMWQERNFEQPLILATITLFYCASFLMAAYVTFWDAPRRVISALGF